jgi:hypothetical protein
MIESNLKTRLMVLRGTLRRACVLDGVGRLILAVVIGLVFAIVFDYFFFRWDRGVNTVFRCLMLAGFIGAGAAISYRRLFVPLSVPLSIDDMALSVEREFPHLNDSLISAVQLTRALADDRTVSAPMVEEVARQAYQESAALDFGRVVKFERLKGVLGAAATAMIVFGVLFATPLQPFLATGIWRVINPLSKATYPVRTEIIVTWEEGRGHEKIVPRNEGLAIAVQVRGALPSKARIQFDYGKGYGREEVLTPVGTRVDIATGERYKEFKYDYNPVISSFNFVVLAGDNQTDEYVVSAVDRPELANMTVEYELPEYISTTRTPPKRERSLRSVAGSKAHLAGEANKPLRSALLKLGDAKPREVDLSPDKTRFAATIEFDESKDYEISLTDQVGLDNRHNKVRHKVWVVPDALPRVIWRKPAQDLDVSPSAVVALALGAEDDWGLKNAAIKFRRYRGATAPATPVQAPGARNVAPAGVDTTSPAVEGGFDLPPVEGAFDRATQRLDLTKDWTIGEMGVEPGDLIEYWAEAYDYCPTARKAMEPQLYRLRVYSVEEIRRKLDIERLRLLEDLKVIIRDQEADKKLVEAAKDHLAVGNPFDNASHLKVSEAGSMQEEVRRKTQALQTAFDNLLGRYIANGLDTPDDKKALEAIRDVLETEHARKMPDASRHIAATATVKTDDDRVLSLRSAATKQEEILNDLRALLEQMQKWAETEDLLRLTRELLLKQRNVTRLTGEFKDRFGVKKPADCSKDEQGQVRALEHEQRDCANDMRALFDRMTQALAKMMELDKWVAKNIDDAIKIAQNTDATPENPDLATTGDPYPGIEDKMRAAQADVSGKNGEPYGFGIANGRQRGAETGLERIITVLSRRRDVDQALMREIDQSRRELQRILDKQRELIKQTGNIQNKQDLERNIGAAKQALQEIRARQQKLLDETRKLQNTADPRAAGLDAAIDAAKIELELVLRDQNKVFKETVDALSPAEREITRAIHELDMLEAEERALAKESGVIGEARIEKALKDQFEAVKNLRTRQEELRSKAGMAETAPDRAKGAEALKALATPQQQLRETATLTLAGLRPTAEQLAKAVPKDSPHAGAAAAAVRALELAASLSGHAPEEMKAAALSLGEAKAKDAIGAQLNGTEKLARAEEALLKALGAERKRFEEAAVDEANRQADTRSKLDEIASRLTVVVRAANTPEQAAKDPKLADAAKGAAKALPELEGSGNDMALSTDTLRRGAGANDRASAAKAAATQVSAADKIAKARAALQGNAEAMAGDKRVAMTMIGGKQEQVRERTKALQAKIEKLTQDVEQAQAAAGAPEKKTDPKDTAGAAQKVAAAAGHMTDAAKDLSKPNPSGATRSESKAIDALEDAREKLGDLRRKTEELKTPSRRLERMQKALKDDTRKLATDVKGLEDQMPAKPDDAKAGENLKNASNNMHNAENNLGSAGDAKNSQAQDAGQQSADAMKDAAKEEEGALSELDKALRALDELASRAAREQDPRTPKVLGKLREPQTLLRDDVLKLQRKLDQLRDKTGSKHADRAASANQSASRNQSAAAGQMGQGSQSGAKSSEEEAEQDLQDALENLDQFQQQMAQQNRNEQLFQIEQELKKMVGVQKDVLGRTQDVEKQRPAATEQLPRRAKLMVKQVFGDQLKLADASKVVVKKLEEAPVFQFVLQGAANDMNEAAGRLDREESGKLTQDIQDDVIAQLNDLIEALRKERTKPRQGGGGGGSGGGGRQPLVPPIAELKMLQIMQRHVNTQTKKIDEEVAKTRTGGQDLSKDQRDRLRRAAVKEGEVARITKRIADDLGQQPPAPGGAAPNGPEEKNEGDAP